MKTLELPKQRIITLCVIISVFFIAGIVFLVLPDEVYIALGDPNPDVGRYVFGLILEFSAIIITIKTLTFVSKQKKLISEYNSLREKSGENAYFIGGYCNMLKKDNTNAIKTTLSVLGATASAVLFGVGVYKIFKSSNTRLYLFFDDGMYIINTQVNEKLLFKKGTLQDVTLTENYKEHLELTCPNENVVLEFDTLKIDVTNDELKQRLQNLFLSEQ